VFRSTPIRARSGAEMNEARLRMTRIPRGADLILNKVWGRLAFGSAM
jgi:molybdopterin-biosynthesis enzyme MoeA-like protein